MNVIMRLLWPAVAALSAGRVIYNDRSGADRLFLTFDDGPSRSCTPDVLDVLAEYRVQATFFMVGKHVATERDIVQRAIKEGHELGNHSLNHPHFSSLTPEQRLAEMHAGERELLTAGGVGPFLFRLPYGEDRADLFSFVLQYGYRLVLWSRDSLDYQSTAPQVVGGFRRRPVTPGDVLLFHDDGPAAAESLRVLLPMWLSQGYSFHVLSELAVRPEVVPLWNAVP